MSDSPLIPKEIITSALDNIEFDCLDSMSKVIEKAIAKIAKNPPTTLEAIASLDWNLSVSLQRPIVDCWQRGAQLGRSHMVLEIQAGIPESFKRENFAATPNDALLKAVQELLQIDPKKQVKNLFSEAAILRRTVQLAKSFSQTQLGKLKVDLVAAISPDSGGKILSRKELLERIQKNFKISESAAQAIARTELTEAYNTGRVKTAQQSPLVTHLRFLAIADDRTSEICISRDGMVIPVKDKGAIAANKPALHVNCRSTLSPLLPAVNPSHKKMVEEKERDYKERELVPLSTGWGNI